MKRLILLIGAVLVGAGLIAALLLSVMRGPGRAHTDWRPTLERYLDFTTDTAGGRAMVVESVKAGQPAQFRDTDFVTFGSARYFSPEVDLDETPLLQSTPVMTGTSASARTGRPIPFPPEEVWCVKVQAPDGQQAVVFASLHADMFMAEWFIHQGETAPYSPELIKFVQAIGCTLALEE